MGSRKKTTPTSPPCGPALVPPVIGALALSLGVVACAGKPVPPMPPPPMPDPGDDAIEEPPRVEEPPEGGEGQPPMEEPPPPMPAPAEPEG